METKINHLPPETDDVPAAAFEPEPEIPPPWPIELIFKKLTMIEALENFYFLPKPAPIEPPCPIPPPIPP